MGSTVLQTNVLVKDITAYFGFGVGPSPAEQSTKARILYGEVNPNGIVSAPKGSLLLRGGVTNALYQNTDGAMAWSPFGGGGGGEDLAATLLIGNFTGGTDIVMTLGDEVLGESAAGIAGNVTLHGGTDTGAGPTAGGAVALRPGAGVGGGSDGVIAFQSASGILFVASRVTAANELTMGLGGAHPFVSNFITGRFSGATALVETETAEPTTGATEGAFFVSDGTGGLNVGHPYFREPANGASTDLLIGTPETLQDVLNNGNFTGGNDIEMTSGDEIVGESSGGTAGDVVLHAGTDTGAGPTDGGDVVFRPGAGVGGGAVDGVVSIFDAAGVNSVALQNTGAEQLAIGTTNVMTYDGVTGNLLNPTALVPKLANNPSTTAAQGALWFNNGVTGSPGALYRRGPSNANAINQTTYQWTGTLNPGVAATHDNVYKTWAELYVDLTNARAAGMVGPFLILVEIGGVRHITAGNYDLENVTFAPNFGVVDIVNDGNYALLEFDEGVTLSGAGPNNGVPAEFSALAVQFDCTATTVYTGATFDNPIRVSNGAELRTKAATATVPAFLLNGGGGSAPIFTLAGGALRGDIGSSEIIRLTTGISVAFNLDTDSAIIGNPISDDGAANNIIIVLLSTSAQRKGTGQGGFPGTLGTAATRTNQCFTAAESLGSSNTNPYGRTPVMDYDSTNPVHFEGLFADARVTGGLVGSVIPGSSTTLVGTEIIFGGLTFDTVANTLSPRGYDCLFTTAAVIGSAQGWSTTSTVCDREAKAFAMFRLAYPGSVAGIRTFVGLTNLGNLAANRALVVDSDNPAGDFLGLQFSTGRGDTHYQFFTKQAGGAQNLVDTGVVPATDQAIYLLVDCRVAGQVTLKLLNGGTRQLLASTTVSVAGNLPVATTALGMISMIEARAAAIKTMNHYTAQLAIGDGTS